MRGGAHNTKPAALRELHGSRTRPRHASEAQFPPLDDAPRDLSPRELLDWKYYAQVLTVGRVLTAGDRDALRLYVRALSEIRAIEANTPIDRRELRQWMQIARLTAADLGLTPASRGRVSTRGVDEDAESSPLAQLLAQGRAIHRVK